MEKYAPNKMELASRDVVSRAEQTEINEGRGVGPDGAGICLDITVVPRKRTLEALREIVNIGRDFAGVDITREPITIQPGRALHHGRRQDRRRRRDPDPRPLRGRRGRLRVGPRRQPPRRELAARHAHLRPPRGRARRRARPADADARGRRAAGCTSDVADDRRDHRPRARRPAHLGDQGRARHGDEPPRRGLPRRGRACSTPTRSCAGSRRRRGRPTSTTAAPSSTRTCSARSSSATCSTAPRRSSSPRSSARSRAARSSAPTSPSATTTRGSSTSTSARNGDDVPEVTYSPVTITQWQPEERKY